MKRFAITSLVGIVALSCGGSGSGADGALPLVTPIVKSATPKGLGGTSATSPKLRKNALLSATDFKSRFFSGAGPTDVLGTLLPNLDDLVSRINSQLASSDSACETQAAVAYTLTPFGQSVTLYAQCFVQLTPQFSGDPGLIQYGIKDGVTYLYAAYGAEWIAAVVTPNATNPDLYSVHAWIGLGYANASTAQCHSVWDGCSYAAMDLTADQTTGSFELAVAGLGIGYCGAQLKADSSNIYAQGSIDMGSSCQPSDTLCVTASNATDPGVCTASLTQFDLTAIGRVSSVSTAPLVVGSWGVSLYPPAPNLTFNGTATDAIHFGPTTPTTGVGELQIAASEKTKKM